MKIELNTEQDYPITVEIEGIKVPFSGILSFSQDVFRNSSISLKLSREFSKDGQKEDNFDDSFKIGGTAVD